MHDLKTLYLQNIPSRPRSKANFTRLLLKHLNPKNEYVKNPRLPLPKNETVGNSKLQLLDTTNNIVAVSLSRSLKLRNQCFITFINHAAAQRFVETFGSKLMIGGRKIDIHFSNKDSLLGLALEDGAALDRVLKTKQLKRKLASDSTKREQHLLKRRLRRLRFNLRSKGLDENTIGQICEAVKATKKQNITAKSISRNKVTNRKLGQGTTKLPASATSANPPNKILLIQNLPPDTTTEALKDVFQGENLVEIRLVNVRRVAFVEYQQIDDAKSIKDSLGDTCRFQNSDISIGFAK